MSSSLPTCQCVPAACDYLIPAAVLQFGAIHIAYDAYPSANPTLHIAYVRPGCRIDRMNYIRVRIHEHV